MSKKLVVRPAARAEVIEAALWYFERNKRAAREFVEAFESGLIAINDNPLQYPEFAPGRRRYIFKHFPYSLIYAIKPDEIVVLACLHGRRNPKRWQRRL